MYKRQDQHLADVQPKAGAAGVQAAGAILLIEPLKHIGQRLRADALPGVPVSYTHLGDPAAGAPMSAALLLATLLMTGLGQVAQKLTVEHWRLVAADGWTARLRSPWRCV